MNTIQMGMKSSGSPHFMAAIAINTPMVREPASPISMMLGEALNQRYPAMANMNSTSYITKSGSAVISMNVNMHMIESDVQSPSTPSVQFITFIDIHISMVASITYTT